jgi:hypothetical protein
VQLLLAKRGSGLPYDTGSASIVLDKSFELLANLTFLGFGAWAIVARGLAGSPGSTPVVHSWALALIPGILILLPVLYLAASFSGRRPLSWLLDQLAARLRGRLAGRLAGGGLAGGLAGGWLQRLSRFRGFLDRAEGQVTAFGRRKARTAGFAILFFLLVWGTTLVETWLALRFLGVAAGWLEVVVLLAGSRFAFLLPFPGALGALEATQVSLFALLGLPPGAAWALLFYIRARDLLFAGVGLLAAGVGLGRHPDSALGAVRAPSSGSFLSQAGDGPVAGGPVAGGRVSAGRVSAGRVGGWAVGGAPLGTGSVGTGSVGTEPVGGGAKVLDQTGQEGFHARVR